jgi:membrane protein
VAIPWRAAGPARRPIPSRWVVSGVVAPGTPSGVGLNSLLRAVDRTQRPRAWLAIPVAVVKRFGESGAGTLAAAIAYYGFFSLFPLLLALTSIGGIVLRDRPDLQERLLNSALAQFPVVGTQIRADVGTLDGSALTIAVGLALALWAGLGAVRATQTAVDTVWDVPRKDRRGAVASIGMSLVMLVVLGAFVVAGAALAAVPAAAAGLAGGVLAILGSLVLNVMLFALAYRVLLSADVTWRAVVPGACLSGAGWTLLLALGGWFVSSRIASSSDVYGTFAVVIGLLAWIYLGAQLTLFGAELNVVIDDHLWPRSLHGDRTPEEERALRRSAMQEERSKEETVNVTFEPGNGGGGSHPTSPSPAALPPRRALASVIKSVIDGATQLFRQQVELAKIEAAEAVQERARAIALLVAAGILSLFALGFLAASGSSALDLVLPTWAAQLIVAGAFVVIGVVVFLVGRSSMRNAGGVDRTQETVKEDVRWAKQRIGR